ncbi:MAG TPA: hypothetical protein VK614_07905 [Allosphingosinicella sp.]|nr:hypothetical protein [Allosphingosinicella sp.]
MDGVMIQLSLPDGKPTLAEAAATVGLDIAELDPEFGVIATDPDAGLYTIKVQADAAERAREALAARGVGGVEGIFSNPKIAPFGPPED